MTKTQTANHTNGGQNTKHAAVAKELTRKMVAALGKLVYNSNALKVTISAIDDTTYAVIINADSNDIPALVGKGGRRIKAIKNMLEKMGRKHGLTIATQLNDYNMGERGPQRRDFAPNYNWQAESVVHVLQDLADELFTGPVTVRHKDVGVLTAFQIVMPARGNEPFDADATIEDLNNLFIGIMKAHGRQMMMRGLRETTG